MCAALDRRGLVERLERGGSRSAAVELVADAGEAVVLGRRLQALAEDHVVPMDLCRILQVLGSAQWRSGQRREALATLTRPRAMAVELGAVVWRDRIDEERARLGGRRDPYELTSTEEQVAELVATGRSNREVANELVVSLRTVRVEPDEDLPQAGHAVAGRAGRRVADEQEGGPAVADPPSPRSRPLLPVGSMAGRWDPARTARMCPPHPAAPGLTVVRPWSAPHDQHRGAATPLASWKTTRVFGLRSGEAAGRP